ncbi:MAG: phosphoribosylformylglycinamidine synthase subunit PurQ [Candidatus Pacebacteria bacterium]|nr:phosphoribosylformylglycinamidine synthase subunit PurQ [Candidatus Paceibacterota bacterium]
MKKTIKKPKVIIFSGYGLNCEEETKFAFEEAGGSADIVHINDVIANPKILDKYQILAMPGGFSYGDDTGSGKAYGNRLRNHLAEVIADFRKRDTLMLGICNGFQILTGADIIEGALTYNESARYIDRWVDLVPEGRSPWTKGLGMISLPIAHGEGKYIPPEGDIKSMEDSGTIAFRYAEGDMCEYQNLPANPNGSTGNIAGVFSDDGRILGMMPHPERGIFFHQRPDAMVLREELKAKGKTIPKYGDGFKLFQNAIDYFKK